MTNDEIQARAREVFRIEAAELLRDLEAALLDLEQRADDLEVLNRVFRVMHTLKGAGATSGYRALSGFVHKIEDVYNGAREGRVKADRALIDLTLQAKDWIERGLAAGVDGEAAVFGLGGDLLGCFARYLDGAPSAAWPSGTTVAAPSVRRTWRWRFAARPAIWLSGVDLGVFWDDLRQLGECRLQGTLSPVTSWETFDPESCGLSWDGEVDTDATEQTLRDVFAFAGDDGELTLERVQPKEKVPERTEANPTTRDVLRVGAAKVDRLVNLVGELVILRAQLQTACQQLPEVTPALAAAEEGLRRLSDEMREVVLEIRMMPVGEAFAKFRRIVRDLAQEMGKDVEWSVEGGDTEMDKTLLDQLADPLMHMVRNSIDHGLETPAGRVAAGKASRGRVVLRAEQRGDRVLISVRDDGKGLDPERIRAKAVERGLLRADQPCTQQELFDLIFLPGFSTADKVSQVSGRGVGMDVVRKRIEALRGTVELWSEKGRGTEVRMSLPLTLAIVDGLLVEVGGEPYILPLGAARETVEMPATERTARQRGRIVEVRGEWLPYLRLRDAFGVQAPFVDGEKLVVMQTDDCTFGIVVDRVLGQHQTVLKSLGWASGRVRVFTGGTVMGDGRVALVVDVPGLVANHLKSADTKQVA